MPEITHEVSVEFEVECAKCRGGLDAEMTNGLSYILKVEPCQTCLDAKYDEGHKDGVEES